jgi:hypothetical protein
LYLQDAPPQIFEIAIVGIDEVVTTGNFTIRMVANNNPPAGVTEWVTSGPALVGDFALEVRLTLTFSSVVGETLPATASDFGDAQFELLIEEPVAGGPPNIYLDALVNAVLEPIP